MGRPKWKTVVTSLLVLLLLLSAVTAVHWKSKLQWRARIISWKFNGSLAYASWPEVLKELSPYMLRTEPSFPPDFVREKGRGENPCPVLWDTQLGVFWGRTADGISLNYALELQLVQDIYQRDPVAVQRGDVVIDCGSHLGTFTRYALNRGARLVVAFEADPTNNICFRRTFEQDITAGRVVLVEAGLWDAPGTLEFAETLFSDSGAVRSVLPPVLDPGHVITVPATTLDDAVQRLNLDDVDFIKWNIQGAERYALRGALRTLAQFRPRMVVSINHLYDDPIVIPSIVLQAVPTYHVFSRRLEQAYFY